MMNLGDQVAIVTGAASGIGREIAKQLSLRGARLALVDIDGDGLQRVADAIRGTATAISTHATDVADEQAVNNMVADVARFHRRISIVINNAGIAVAAPFEGVSFDDYDRLMRTNFWGAVYLCRHSLQFLKSESDARIVNVSSGFASLGFPNKTAYCSSKAALVGFSNALYTELYDTSVRVSIAIAPAVDTNLIRNARAIDQNKQQLEADFVARHGMPVERAARAIINGMARGTFRIKVGITVRLIDVMCRWFPTITQTAVARNKSKFRFV